MIRAPTGSTLFSLVYGIKVVLSAKVSKMTLRMDGLHDQLNDQIIRQTLNELEEI